MAKRSISLSPGLQRELAALKTKLTASANQARASMAPYVARDLAATELLKQAREARAAGDIPHAVALTDAAFAALAQRVS